MKKRYPQIESTIKKYNRKKICSFNISEDIINKFNHQVDYNFRSKTINQIISDFLENKKDAGTQPALTQSFRQEKRRLK